MKYTLTVNQKQALELGITNINQAIILGLIADSHSWAETEIVNSVVYYWTARQKIAEELEILNLKPDSVYRHLKSLEKLGLIDYIKSGKKDCVKLTKKGKTYYVGNKSEKDENSEINPTKLGNKSEKNSEINPTYKSYKYNKSYKDNISSIAEKAVSMWNEFATSNNKPKVLKLTSKRRDELLKRIKELKDYEAALRMTLEKASKSEFCLSGKWFSFDWLIENDTNLIKVFEGKYDDEVVEYH